MVTKGTITLLIEQQLREYERAGMDDDLDKQISILQNVQHRIQGILNDLVFIQEKRSENKKE